MQTVSGGKAGCKGGKAGCQESKAWQPAGTGRGVGVEGCEGAITQQVCVQGSRQGQGEVSGGQGRVPMSGRCMRGNEGTSFAFGQLQLLPCPVLPSCSTFPFLPCSLSPPLLPLISHPLSLPPHFVAHPGGHEVPLLPCSLSLLASSPFSPPNLPFPPLAHFISSPPPPPLLPSLPHPPSLCHSSWTPWHRVP